MKFLNYVTLICLLFYTSLTTSQETDTDKNLWQTFTYDLASMAGGVANAYTQPIRWKGKDWATFGAILGGSAILLSVDEPANAYFTNQSAGVPHFIKESAFRFGKPLVKYGISTGIYGIGLFSKNEKIRRTGVLLISSASASGMLLTLTKSLTGRARPYTGEGNMSFQFWDDRPSYHSFPSGHSVLSFTMAHVLAKQFDNMYIKSGIYALGLVTPISRMWANAHWLTDVAVGIALSVVIVDGIDNYLTRKERYSSTKKSSKISWDLRLGTGQIGIVGTFR